MIVHVEGLPVRKQGGTVIAYALVDPEDFPRFNDFAWFMRHHGYVARSTHRIPVYLHREVLGLGRDDKEHVDHINGDPLDNRRCNLRLTTAAQNAQNRPNWRPGFGHRGVSFDKRRARWVAQCTINGRNKHLGYFASEDEAVAAARAYRAEQMPYSVEARA
jgi:hypothetical protein